MARGEGAWTLRLGGGRGVWSWAGGEAGVLGQVRDTDCGLEPAAAPCCEAP